MTAAKDYADRIYEAARHDGYPNKPTQIDAFMLASRYNVVLNPVPATLKEVCLVIAETELEYLRRKSRRT